MRSVWLLALAGIVAGCHAKFKREVRTIDDAQLTILTQAGASASLGRAAYVGDPTPESKEERTANLVGAVATGVFNTVQAVKEIDIMRRINQTVDIEKVNSAMLASLAASLGDGPPFAAVPSGRSENLLQLEVIRWGLQVPAVGVPGSFDYEVRARMYKGDGERIYSSRLTCQIQAGTPNVASEALLLVNNAKQVKQMSDEELQSAFEAMASYCGGVFVARMRRHAG